MRSVEETRQELLARIRAVPENWRLLVAPSITFVILLGLTIVITQTSTQGASFRLQDFQIGGVAPRDVVADRDLQYTDEIATQLKLEAAQTLTPPVLRVNDEITRITLERFDQFDVTFLSAFKEQGDVRKAFLQVQLVFPVSVTAEQIARLNSTAVVEEVLDRSREILEGLLEQGIVSVPESLREHGRGALVELWRWSSGRLERTEMAVSRLVTMDSLAEQLDAALRSARLQRDSDTRELVRSVVGSFARENTFEDTEETRRAVERAKAAVVPEIARLVKGQSIVRKGDLVTDEALARLRAMGAHRVTLGANAILSAALLFLAVMGLGVYLLHERRTGVTLSQPQVVFLCLSATLYVLAGSLAVRLFANPLALPLSVFLPTASVAILVSIVVSPVVAVGFTMCMSTLLLAPLRLEVGAFLFAYLSGIAGIAVVSRTKTRIDLIKAGAILSLLNLPPLFAIGFMNNAESGWFAVAALAGVSNGFLCGVLALGLLPILDHALNTATRFRLMELSDINSPILKRMLTLAPGTYIHSLSVANLAESACTEIGANYLLARVGAYYHDIGKIEQAEYFVENQTSENKHDELKPSLSVAVIKSHVKIGVEKGKELSLPAEVVDIIAQHHGRDLIKYFYHRAKTGPESGSVSTGDYSYRGKRPRSREAAVVMLADAAEAVTRTLRHPSAAKLEKTVWGIIMDRFTRGELSESALTFRDLETIKRSFVRILAGHFHTRIEYPKLPEGGA